MRHSPHNEGDGDRLSFLKCAGFRLWKRDFLFRRRSTFSLKSRRLSGLLCRISGRGRRIGRSHNSRKISFHSRRIYAPRCLFSCCRTMDILGSEPYSDFYLDKLWGKDSTDFIRNPQDGIYPRDVAGCGRSRRPTN